MKHMMQRVELPVPDRGEDDPDPARPGCHPEEALMSAVSERGFPAPGSWVRRRTFDGFPDPNGLVGQVQPYDRPYAQTFPVKFWDIWRNMLPSEVEILPYPSSVPLAARDLVA